MLFSKLSPRLSFPQRDSIRKPQDFWETTQISLLIFKSSAQVALRCFVLDTVTEMQLNVTLLNTLSGGLSLND